MGMDSHQGAVLSYMDGEIPAYGWADAEEELCVLRGELVGWVPMASATFDTLHAAKALTAAGFEAQQAEAITDTIREAFTESVATKADIAEVRADMAELRAELKADIAGLYKHLWLMGLGIVTAVAAIVKLL